MFLSKLAVHYHISPYTSLTTVLENNLFDLGEKKDWPAITKNTLSSLHKVYFCSMMCSNAPSLFLGVSNHRSIYPPVVAKGMTQAGTQLVGYFSFLD